MMCFGNDIVPERNVLNMMHHVLHDDWGIDCIDKTLGALFLLKCPQFSQPTPHFSLRAGWRDHTAEKRTKQSAKSTKAKNPSYAVLTVIGVGVGRIGVSFSICGPEDRTRHDSGNELWEDDSEIMDAKNGPSSDWGALLGVPIICLAVERAAPRE